MLTLFVMLDAGTNDGGYWVGRVARLEREAATVEEAVLRGRERPELAREPDGMGGARPMGREECG